MFLAMSSKMLKWSGVRSSLFRLRKTLKKCSIEFLKNREKFSVQSNTYSRSPRRTLEDDVFRALLTMPDISIHHGQQNHALKLQTNKWDMSLSDICHAGKHAHSYVEQRIFTGRIVKFLQMIDSRVFAPELNVL